MKCFGFKVSGSGCTDLGREGHERSRAHRENHVARLSVGHQRERVDQQLPSNPGDQHLRRQPPPDIQQYPTWLRTTPFINHYPTIESMVAAAAKRTFRRHYPASPLLFTPCPAGSQGDQITRASRSRTNPPSPSDINHCPIIHTSRPACLRGTPPLVAAPSPSSTGKHWDRHESNAPTSAESIRRCMNPVLQGCENS